MWQRSKEVLSCYTQSAILMKKKRIRLLIESNIQVDNGYVFPKDLRLSYIISPLELVLMHEDSGKIFLCQKIMINIVQFFSLSFEFKLISFVDQWWRCCFFLINLIILENNWVFFFNFLLYHDSIWRFNFKRYEIYKAYYIENNEIWLKWRNGTLKFHALKDLSIQFYFSFGI